MEKPVHGVLSSQDTVEENAPKLNKNEKKDKTSSIPLPEKNAESSKNEKNILKKNEKSYKNEKSEKSEKNNDKVDKIVKPDIKKNDDHKNTQKDLQNKNDNSKKIIQKNIIEDPDTESIEEEFIVINKPKKKTRKEAIPEASSIKNESGDDSFTKNVKKN